MSSCSAIETAVASPTARWRRCAACRCLERGQIVTVIGPNGAGKTTLLGAAMGLLPSRGRMSSTATICARLDVEARVERGLCLVPEKRELFGDLSVPTTCCSAPIAPCATARR